MTTGTRNYLDRAKISELIHELKTPIASIRGVNHMLRRQLKPLSENLDLGAERLLILQDNAINELLQVVERGLELGVANEILPPVPFAVQLAKYISSIVTDWNLSQAHGRLRLLLTIDENYTANLFVPEFRLIFSNLVSNALKYSPEHSIVDLSVADEGDFWRLEVKDYGCGIPKAEQNRLFQRYFRASNVADKSGSGLGLYLVRNAVSSCKGTIEVDSSAHRGAEFKVRFPRLLVGDV